MENTKNIPPIFVISLKHSPRRNTISQRMNDLGIPFRFIDAIYGKTLSKEQLQCIDYTFYVNRFAGHKPLTLGEIGCAMSHIKVYQHILNNNINEAIILEDDAIVNHHFQKILKDVLKKIPKKRDLIFFDHGKAKYWPLLKKALPEGYRLVKYRYPSKNSKRIIMRATAYLITLNAARKLLELAYPIRMPADYLLGAIQISKLRAYGIEPPCVFVSGYSEINKIEERYN